MVSLYDKFIYEEQNYSPIGMFCILCYRSGIAAVQAEDVKEKPKEGAIIPGRVVRRAKRQTSSQTSYDG